MAGSVNKVIILGNLGKDPEIRRTQDGKPICNLTVATSETWRDKSSGERKEKASTKDEADEPTPISQRATAKIKRPDPISSGRNDDLDDSIPF
jgi:hypothetical protein